jgi:hypothetical protein
MAENWTPMPRQVLVLILHVERKEEKANKNTDREVIDEQK